MEEFCRTSCPFHRSKVGEESGTGDVLRVYCLRKGLVPILEIRDQAQVAHFLFMAEQGMDTYYTDRTCLFPRS